MGVFMFFGVCTIAAVTLTVCVSIVMQFWDIDRSFQRHYHEMHDLYDRLSGWHCENTVRLASLEESLAELMILGSVREVVARRAAEANQLATKKKQRADIERYLEGHGNKEG